MPEFIVPKNVGNCIVFRNWTGHWIVANSQGGQSRVFIPCNTRPEAEAICEQLNTGDHNGQINVPHPHRHPT